MFFEYWRLIEDSSETNLIPNFLIDEGTSVKDVHHLHMDKQRVTVLSNLSVRYKGGGGLIKAMCSHA